MSDNPDYPLALQPPSLPYAIRPVTLSDVEQLREALWQDRSLESLNNFVQRVNKFESQGRGIGIVIVDPTHLPNPLLAYGQVTQWVKCAEISDLMVIPDYRGQGIGTAMIQYLAAYIAPKVPCIELGVAESNPRALALYRRLGFADSYTLQLDLGNGIEPVLYLQIDLAPFRDEE